MMAGCDKEVSEAIKYELSNQNETRRVNGSQIAKEDFVTPWSKRLRARRSTRTGLSGTPLDGLNPAAKNVSERINLQ